MDFDFKRMVKRELNVGLKEQRIRYGAGSAAILVSVFLGNIPLLLLGAYLAATARLRWCPVYSGMARSTADPSEETTSGCCGGHGSHG